MTTVNDHSETCLVIGLLINTCMLKHLAKTTACVYYAQNNRFHCVYHMTHVLECLFLLLQSLLTDPHPLSQCPELKHHLVGLVQ